MYVPNVIVSFILKTADKVSGKPYTLRGVCTVWEGVEACPFRRMCGNLPHDTTLFLGGSEKSTLKDMAELLGKETIDYCNTSDTRGSSPSYGVSYQKTGRELMSQDEIAVMDGEKCIMQLRGVRPFFSNKFDITKHKQYQYLSDYDEKNAFDVENYLKNRTKFTVKQNSVVDEVIDFGNMEENI